MARINSSGTSNVVDASEGDGQQLTRWAPLKTTSTVLRSLRGGIEGFTRSGFGSCRLALSTGRAVEISAVETLVAPRFECFSLAMQPDAMTVNVTVPFKSSADAEASILIREEYVEAYDGDATRLVGSAPRTIQKATVPGHVPAHALMSCQTAYGLLIEGAGGRLLVAADWAPFNVVVTTDEDQISKLLAESEMVSSRDYIERYQLQA
jgi:hypothetical protein